MKIERLWQKSHHTGLPLYVEIAIVLFLKVLSIFVLWKLFFAQPQTKKMRLPTATVEQHLLSNTNSSASSAAPSIKIQSRSASAANGESTPSTNLGQ